MRGCALLAFLWCAELEAGFRAAHGAFFPCGLNGLTKYSASFRLLLIFAAKLSFVSADKHWGQHHENEILRAFGAGWRGGANG